MAQPTEQRPQAITLSSRPDQAQPSPAEPEAADRGRRGFGGGRGSQGGGGKGGDGGGGSARRRSGSRRRGGLSKGDWGPLGKHPIWTRSWPASACTCPCPAGSRPPR